MTDHFPNRPPLLHRGGFLLYNDFIRNKLMTDDSRETTITEEQLNRLWNALEYTLGTIGTGCLFKSESNPEYVEIHRGRAVQSRHFLTDAKSTVNRLKLELK